MKKAGAIIWYWLTAPFYFLIMVGDAVLGPTSIADWAAGKLGLQGRGPGATVPTTGSDGLVGALAEVIEDFTPVNGRLTGRVRLKGEIWSARTVSNRPPMRGSSVRVTFQDGLSLGVEPIDSK